MMIKEQGQQRMEVDRGVARRRCKKELDLVCICSRFVLVFVPVSLCY